MRSLLVVLFAMMMACTTSRVPTKDVSAADPALTHDLVGTTPTAWKTEAWVNSPPLTLEGLRAKVGRVRCIHPGGRYAPGDASYEAIRRGVEKLIAEPNPGT